MSLAELSHVFCLLLTEIDNRNTKRKWSTQKTAFSKAVKRLKYGNEPTDALEQNQAEVVATEILQGIGSGVDMSSCPFC